MFLLHSVPTPPVGPDVRKRHLISTDQAVKKHRNSQSVDFSSHNTSRDDVVRYFMRIAALVGCRDDMYVMSRGWDILIRALSVSSPGTASQDVSAPPRSIKAIVIACISLGVEVAGDFEAPYIVSTAAWGRFFSFEISVPAADYKGTDHLSKLDASDIESACKDLMRLKLVISAGLEWNLQSRSSADIFTGLATKLIETTNCEDCETCLTLCANRTSLVAFAVPILNALSFYWLSQGVSPEVVGLMTLLVTHETFKARVAMSGSVVNRLRRILSQARRSIETNGLSECFLRLADRTYENASVLLQARDLLVDDPAVILQLVDVYSPSPRTRSVLHDIDTTYQSLFGDAS